MPFTSEARLRRWFGTGEELGEAFRVVPLYSLRAVQAAFALGPVRRRDELLHFEITRRACDKLARMPFAERVVDQGRRRRAPRSGRVPPAAAESDKRSHRRVAGEPARSAPRCDRGVSTRGSVESGLRGGEPGGRRKSADRSFRDRQRRTSPPLRGADCRSMARPPRDAGPIGRAAGSVAPRHPYAARLLAVFGRGRGSMRVVRKGWMGAVLALAGAALSVVFASSASAHSSRNRSTSSTTGIRR